MLYNFLLMGVPWVLVGLGLWLAYQLVRAVGRILLRLDALEGRLAALPTAPPAPAAPTQPAPPALKELPLGSPAPAFDLPDLEGKKHTLDEYRGRRLLLLFFNPHCGFCTRMADRLAALPAGADASPLPVVVSTGPADDNRDMAAEYGLKMPLLLQPGMEVAHRYGAGGTPMGYLIDEEGKVASRLTVGQDALLALAGAAPAPAAPPAPSGCKKCGKGKCECGRAAEAAPEPAVVAEAGVEDYALLVLPAGAGAVELMGRLQKAAESCRRLIVRAAGGEGFDETALAGMRRFLRENTEWSVAFAGGADGVMVLSRDPRDRKPLPSTLKMAANFARAVAAHIGDGRRRLTPLQLERRLEICALCDKRTGDRCSACGCDLLTKAGWRSSDCPLKKWPAPAETDNVPAPPPANGHIPAGVG